MYLSALNRFIHTCSKQKVDISRYFLEKHTFLDEIRKSDQKSVFFGKISRYIDFLFRTSADKSISALKYMLPYKKYKILKNLFSHLLVKLKK